MQEIHKFYDLVLENATQVWTLVSVALGGMVTYVSTSMAEKRKNKRQLQIDRMEQVLIPYCTCIEETIEVVKKIYDKSSYSNKELFQRWISELNKPLDYLKANKRVYLTPSARNLLEELKIQIDNFEVMLDKDTDFCLIEYKHIIADYLEGFDEEAMNITFSMKENSPIKIKLALISKSEISLINEFTSFNFIHNDDPDNYSRIKIDIKDDYRDTWGGISYGLLSYGDISTDDERIACDLLEFIDNKVSNEKELLTKIIDKTNSAYLLRNIMDKLEEIQRKLLREIDKIAI